MATVIVWTVAGIAFLGIALLYLVANGNNSAMLEKTAMETMTTVLSEVQKLCNRVAILREGKLISIQSMEDLRGKGG